MDKVKSVILVGLLLGILAINATTLSPLGDPPGWNGGEYMSVLDEES